VWIPDVCSLRRELRAATAQNVDEKLTRERRRRPAMRSPSGVAPLHASDTYVLSVCSSCGVAAEQDLQRQRERDRRSEIPSNRQKKDYLVCNSNRVVKDFDQATAGPAWTLSIQTYINSSKMAMAVVGERFNLLYAELHRLDFFLYINATSSTRPSMQLVDQF